MRTSGFFTFLNRLFPIFHLSCHKIILLKIFLLTVSTVRSELYYFLIFWHRLCIKYRYGRDQQSTSGTGKGEKMKLKKTHIKLCDRTILDGHFGHTIAATFAFDEKSGAIIIYHKTGHYKSLLSHAIDLQDALYMIDNDPVSKKYYKNII